MAAELPLTLLSTTTPKGTVRHLVDTEDTDAVTLCGRNHGTNPNYVHVGTELDYIGPAENATCAQCRKVAESMVDTPVVTDDGELADHGYDIADRLQLALEAAGPAGLTPSAAGRKAKTDSVTARHVLDWMLAHQYVHTTGNGAWSHYHAGRA